MGCATSAEDHPQQAGGRQQATQQPARAGVSGGEIAAYPNQQPTSQQRYATTGDTGSNGSQNPMVRRQSGRTAANASRTASGEFGSMGRRSGSFSTTSPACGGNNGGGGADAFYSSNGSQHNVPLSFLTQGPQQLKGPSSFRRNTSSQSPVSNRNSGVMTTAVSSGQYGPSSSVPLPQQLPQRHGGGGGSGSYSRHSNHAESGSNYNNAYYQPSNAPPAVQTTHSDGTSTSASASPKSQRAKLTPLVLDINEAATLHQMRQRAPSDTWSMRESEREESNSALTSIQSLPLANGSHSHPATVVTPVAAQALALYQQQQPPHESLYDDVVAAAADVNKWLDGNNRPPSPCRDHHQHNTTTWIADAGHFVDDGM